MKEFVFRINEFIDLLILQIYETGVFFHLMRIKNYIQNKTVLKKV